MDSFKTSTLAEEEEDWIVHARPSSVVDGGLFEELGEEEVAWSAVTDSLFSASNEAEAVLLVETGGSTAGDGLAEMLVEEEGDETASASFVVLLVSLMIIEFVSSDVNDLCIFSEAGIYYSIPIPERPMTVRGNKCHINVGAAYFAHHHARKIKEEES